jgi:hypothetical protein
MLVNVTDILLRDVGGCKAYPFLTLRGHIVQGLLIVEAEIGLCPCEEGLVNGFRRVGPLR